MRHDVKWQRPDLHIMLIDMANTPQMIVCVQLMTYLPTARVCVYVCVVGVTDSNNSQQTFSQITRVLIDGQATSR